MKICGIYKIVHRETGRAYVGQSVDIKRRWGIHRGGHAKQCRHLSSAIAAYGSDAFDWVVIEECDRSRLDEREAHWVRELGSMTPAGFNLTTGGDSSKKSAETLAKFSATMRGRPKSEAHRRAISAAKKGKPKTPEHVAKFVAAMTGRKASAETRRKMSEAHRALNQDPAVRQRKSEQMKRRMSDPEYVRRVITKAIAARTLKKEVSA